MTRMVLVGPVAGLALAATAQAGITITQGSSAPTYSHTLNFDEAGGPVGQVPATGWTAHGIARLESGVNPFVTVADLTSQPGFGWLGTGNSAYAPWGAFITWDQDLTEFSTRYWDSSGPGGPFGGGALVVALSGGVEVGNFFITNPAYGGVGNPWINVTTSAGTTFDEIRLLGFGFFPEAYIDDLSWNAVPAPASAAALVFLGAGLARRRRA
ncbi:MAG: hypothetical protein IT436_11825 [Phycisphaerales bacterium]|nr:hypothetical protein [Phycisphaerales bacterium]